MTQVASGTIQGHAYTISTTGDASPAVAYEGQIFGFTGKFPTLTLYDSSQAKVLARIPIIIRAERF